MVNGLFVATADEGQYEPMQVLVLYFADCPNWAAAGQRMRAALDVIGCDDVEVRFQAVETEEEAAAVGFGGSPTFLVDDVDLFGPPVTAGALSCRVYPTDIGLSGVPALAALVAKLEERENTPGDERADHSVRAAEPELIGSTGEPLCR